MVREKLRQFLFPWSHESILFEVTARCNLSCRHCYNLDFARERAILG